MNIPFFSSPLKKWNLLWSDLNNALTTNNEAAISKCIANINTNYFKLKETVERENKENIEKISEPANRIDEGKTKIFSNSRPTTEIPNKIDVYGSVYKFPVVTKYLYSPENVDKQIRQDIFRGKLEEDVRKEKVKIALTSIGYTDSKDFIYVIRGEGNTSYSTNSRERETEEHTESFKSKYWKNKIKPYIEDLLNYGTASVVATVLNQNIFGDKLTVMLQDIKNYFKDFLSKDQISQLKNLFEQEVITKYIERKGKNDIFVNQQNEERAAQRLTEENLKKEENERQRNLQQKKYEEVEAARKIHEQQYNLQNLPNLINAEVKKRVDDLNLYIKNEYLKANSSETPVTYQCTPTQSSLVGGKRHLKRRKTTKRGTRKTGPRKTGLSKRGTHKIRKSKIGGGKIYN